MTSPSFVSGSATDPTLRQQFVERLVLRIHPGALNGVDHHIGSVFRAMAALCRSPKPVILLRGHEGHKHERAGPVAGYLHRLALRFVLEPAELALVSLSAGYGS